MPKTLDDFKYLVVATFEITSLMHAIPIKSRKAQALGEGLIHALYSTFTEVIPFMLRVINCQMEIISSFNHGSLRTERQIQITGKMITKHLVLKGEMWPLYTNVKFMP